MAIPHALPGDAVDVGPLGPSLLSTRSFALFKSANLEVIRLVLPAGKVVPAHEVPGDISIQCLEGRIEIGVDQRTLILEAGQLLFLPGCTRHEIRAPENASALLTIALQP